MRSCATTFLALALIASPPPALAQNEPAADTTRKLNEPLEKAKCVSQVLGGDPYPFSVGAVGKALIRPRHEVNLLVVDNAFYGYDLSDEAQTPDDPVRVSSKNFPSAFFSERGGQNDFSPFVEETNAPAVPPPDPSSPLIDFHGTLITGIVLGGMYDDNQAPQASNLTKPSVRSLLVNANDPSKSWLQVSFLILDYGDGASSDPINALNRIGASADEMSIINMSLAKALSGSENSSALNDRQSLIVTAAGNSGQRLSRSQLTGVVAMPAALTDTSRLLVVASHDADGRLSTFSNYGRLVNIAAPGCEIKSWSTGDAEARSASGTSMATAIVSFAAALVRSQWPADPSAIAIRNRILSSARYNPLLDRCYRLPPLQSGPPVAAPPYCVRDGAMLDITAAVSIGRDLVEYDECGSPAPAGCKPTLALGNLEEQPTSPFRDCLLDEEIPTKMVSGGLSRNGAAKRIDQDSFLIDWEGGNSVGEAVLNSKTCTLPPGSGDFEFLFRVKGPQPDSRSMESPDPRHIRLKDLNRLVIRAI